MSRPPGADAQRRLLLVVALTILVLASLAAPATATASLSGRLVTILSSHGLAGSGTGLKVIDLDSGATLYSRNATRLLTPASNMKLVTSATALGRFGEEYRFRTEVYLPPESIDTGGVVRGDVYIKGYGDPTLSTASYRANVMHRAGTDIGQVVTVLQSLGVTRVVGHIVGDETYFDARRTVASWGAGDTAYCGPLSALCLNQGNVDGRRAADPALATAKKVTELVEGAGIEITGGARVGAVPGGWLLRGTLWSPPLPVVLRGMNKPSDNFYAEEITKALGAAFRGAGTTTAGARVEAAFLVGSGVATSQFKIYDGSGLSHSDRLTAGGVARLLRVMSARDDYPSYWASLSIAGRDGTLRDRMRGTAAQGNLHGKTGTLSGASCLSGYVVTANGHHVLFSILMNGSGLSVSTAHTAQDQIAVTLANARL